MSLICKETALKNVSFDTEAYNAINMIPSVDAVEVVLCKDCLNWDTSFNSKYSPTSHYCPMIHYVTDANFYCAEAERKQKMATKRFNFKFHCEKDADIIQRLADQENMQDYIRLLIRSDILADSIKLTLANPDQEQDRESTIEFQRRADLMARFCHGAIEDNDSDYCYSCMWSYHPDNYSDTIRCKFDGLSADEMEKVIKNSIDRIKQEIGNHGTN